MDEYAEEELHEALDALADGEKMRQVGVTEKAIVTRLYYACFMRPMQSCMRKDTNPKPTKARCACSVGKWSRPGRRPLRTVGF